MEATPANVTRDEDMMSTIPKSEIERSTVRVFCKRADGGHEKWCGGLEIDKARFDAEVMEGNLNLVD